MLNVSVPSVKRAAVVRDHGAPELQAKVATGAVEAALGERRGERTDLPANAGRLAVGETADVAAQKAGFGSGDTYARAKKVVAEGTPELVAAMDEGMGRGADREPRAW